MIYYKSGKNHLNDMKTTILILLIISSRAFAQVDTVRLFRQVNYNDKGTVEFQDVHEVDSVSQSVLYARAKEFIVNYFKSANEVIQMDDREEGIIIGKGYTDIEIETALTTSVVQMWFTVKIQAKDGRYRYTIYDIYFKSYPHADVIGQSHINSPILTTPAEDMFDYSSRKRPAKIRDKYKFQMLRTVNRLIKELALTIKVKNSKSDKW